LNTYHPPFIRIHLALVLLSAALIAFQLEQMQLLALVQWHHFAYLIISVALLGFGASGMVIALFREFILRRLDILLPFLLFGCSMTMVMALPVSQDIVGRFDISLLFVDPVQAGLLLAGQSIYLLVFFLGALPLGLVFVHFSSRIGSLYCVNLIGSGIGGVLAVSCMYIFLPQKLPALTALLPWLGGLLVMPARRRIQQAVGILSLLLIFFFLFFPPSIKPSPYKSFSRTMDLPGAKVQENIPSPYGLVQLVTAQALRYAPGLSLTYTQTVPPLQAAVFNNGDWFGAVENFGSSTLQAQASALPFAIRRPDRVLVLDAGTGTDVMQAMVLGAGKIRAVDPHRRAVEAAAGAYADGSFSLLHDPGITYTFLASRTLLAMDNRQYDLIVLPDVGSFGGSSGLFALREQYLLTKESFYELWKHLSPEGMLRVSSWSDSPPRNALRLAATIAETLEEEGVQADLHVAAIRGWDMITFIVKRAPLTKEDIVKIRTFSERLQFDPAILPGLPLQERQKYHAPAETDYFNYLVGMFSPDRRQDIYAKYSFDLRPVTDNRPFFSQFLRWKTIPSLMRLFGEHTAPFLELGFVLVLISFMQMAVAAVLLILLPLFRLKVPGRPLLQRWALPYFSGLGLGYMFFEIVLIHEMILYLGNPIFAASAVISGLLIFSGLGSLYSSRLTGYMPSHFLAASLVAALLLCYRYFLPPVLHAGIGLPVAVKYLFFMVLIAPPSFIMGMPFPLGLARLAGHSKSQAAWAWGINGSVSVVSTSLATIIAVELGFSAVMVIACGGYGLAALAGYKTYRLTSRKP